MREFEIQISEILVKTIKIKAKDQQEACMIAKKAYDDSEIVLDAGDFLSVEFKILKE
ncbi:MULTISPECIES: DpnD/PcfM family protein [unclassified Campylobacter]|uniref:DpnD/PcfM family protein n=1 Tax=unclassified Campylobacter TaxID=2593542 RepID=UPI003D32551B